MTGFNTLIAALATGLAAGALLAAPAVAQGKPGVAGTEAPKAQAQPKRGEPVEIEIITFGPGLHMLRDDTSPVKDRIKSMAENRPSVQFKACGNTQENMSKAESKKIPLVTQASMVPSGVVRILELQEQGWSYVRP